MKRALFIFILTSLTLFQGCAWKENQEEAQILFEHRLDGRVLGMTVQWEGLDRPLAIRGESIALVRTRQWSHSKVLSLPVHVPETLDLELRIAHEPEFFQNMKASAVVTTGEDLHERHLGVEHIESTPFEIGTLLKIRLTGIRTLFKVNEEQRIFLTLALQSSQQEEPISISLILSTPPSRLPVIARTRITEELRRSPANPGSLQNLMTLSSQAETRHLVETVRLRNDSFEKIQLSIPFKTHATVRLRGRRFWSEVIPNSNPHVPQYGQREQEEVHDFESDFSIFPLKEDLPLTWTGFSQKDLEKLALLPGESIDMGVYAEGAAIAQMASFPASRTSTEQKTVDATARCPAQFVAPIPQIGPPYCDLSAEGSRWGYFPSETVALCKQAISTMDSCIKSDFGNRELCNQAALLDDELDRRRRPIPGTNTLWHIWFGCRTWIPTPDGQHAEKWVPMWNWDPVYGTLRVGIETEPVTAHWGRDEVQSIPVAVRFAPEGASGQEEARLLPLISDGLILRN